MRYPGVAKFGIALEWGSRGRWFESSHSDHEIPQSIETQWVAGFLFVFHTLDCHNSTLDFGRKF